MEQEHGSDVGQVSGTWPAEEATREDVAAYSEVRSIKAAKEAPPAPTTIGWPSDSSTRSEVRTFRAAHVTTPEPAPEPEPPLCEACGKVHVGPGETFCDECWCTAVATGVAGLGAGQ